MVIAAAIVKHTPRVVIIISCCGKSWRGDNWAAVTVSFTDLTLWSYDEEANELAAWLLESNLVSTLETVTFVCENYGWGRVEIERIF